MIIPSYKLDRTAFKAKTLEEAADHTAYYNKISWKECLRVSAYLFTFGIPPVAIDLMVSVKGLERSIAMIYYSQRKWQAGRKM